MTEIDRDTRRRIWEAFNEWAISPAARDWQMGDPRRIFETAYLAGKLDAELDALGLEPVSLPVLTKKSISDPVRNPEFVGYKGKLYQRKASR